MKKLMASLALGALIGSASASNVSFTGKVSRLMRENSAVTCTTSDVLLLLSITGTSSTRDIRMSTSAVGYNDIISMLLTAASTGMNVDIIYDNTTSVCNPGKDGILLSVTLVP